MKDLKESLNVGGYSQEENYFQQNQWLIEELHKKRAKLFELGKQFDGTQAPRQGLRQRERASA